MAEGAASNGAVPVGTSSTTIVAANSTRRSVLIQNLHASNVLYVGVGTVTTANGIRLNPGDSCEFTQEEQINGIASGASTDVRYFEEV